MKPSPQKQVWFHPEGSLSVSGDGNGAERLSLINKRHIRIEIFPIIMKSGLGEVSTSEALPGVKELHKELHAVSFERPSVDLKNEGVFSNRPAALALPSNSLPLVAGDSAIGPPPVGWKRRHLIHPSRMADQQRSRLYQGLSRQHDLAP